MNTTKYKLKKDLPDLSAGAIFYWDDRNGLYTNDALSYYAYTYPKWVIEENIGIWFEELDN